MFCRKKMVDFVICGTQKGGTTALDAYLREHPKICMATTKEVHYFDEEQYFVDNAPDYSVYHDFFEPKWSHSILGEATPIYMYWRACAKRIRQYNPNMKIIVLLRNPIERAYSHWNMECLLGLDDVPFWEAISTEQERSKDVLPQQHRVYSYVDRGFYVEQLERLWHYFPKNQVLIIKNEDLKRQPNETLERVCNFLDVPVFETVIEKDVHSRPYKSKLSERERDFLARIFEPEISKLEAVLDWDCSDWR